MNLDVRTLYLKDQTFFGCTELDRGVFDRLVKTIQEGLIRPLVAEIYPLKQIGLAQESFNKKKFVGKIVLEISK